MLLERLMVIFINKEKVIIIDCVFIISLSASSLTAMEAWIVGCLIFVFFALIEYGALLKVMSSTKEKTEQVEGEAKVRRRRRR